MGRITKKLTQEERKKKQEQLTQKRTTVTESGEVVVEKPKPAPVAPAKPTAKASNKEPNFFQKAAQFLRETKLEFKRVTWPTRQQTIATTAVIIILVIIIAIFLGIVDMVLSGAVRAVLRS